MSFLFCMFMVKNKPWQYDEQTLVFYPLVWKAILFLVKHIFIHIRTVFLNEENIIIRLKSEVCWRGFGHKPILK